MKCPCEVEKTLLSIIELGLLNARYYLGKGDHSRCLKEIEHIHNIPTLIKEFTPDLFLFYKKVVIEEYHSQTEGSISKEMKDFIEKLLQIAPD
jgi:hypothetical protein